VESARLYRDLGKKELEETALNNYLHLEPQGWFAAEARSVTDTEFFIKIILV